MSENKLQKKSGTVVKKLFGKGSKSEYLAWYLICDDGKEFVLQRQDANPFMDNFFEDYLNKKVVCKGSVSDYVFFVEEIVFS